MDEPLDESGGATSFEFRGSSGGLKRVALDESSDDEVDTIRSNRVQILTDSTGEDSKEINQGANRVQILTDSTGENSKESNQGARALLFPDLEPDAGVEKVVSRVKSAKEQDRPNDQTDSKQLKIKKGKSVIMGTHAKGELKKKMTFIKDADRPFYKEWVDDHCPWLVEFVNGIAFENAVGVLILFNCVTIGVDVHMCPPETSPRSSEGCPATFLMVSENACTALFVLEFLLRGICLTFSYYIRSWDRMADAFLVWGTGVLLNWVLGPITSDLEGARMISALRAFRLLRVIRIVRFKPAFRSFWMLFRGLASSSSTLFSTVLVILFVNYMFGIWAVTLIGDSTDFTKGQTEAQEYFGGLDKTLFTLAQMITGDGWATDIARPILKVMPGMWIFFLLYIAIGILVLMNLVTAILVENAMASSNQDEDIRLREKDKERRTISKNLEEIFKELDEDGSGDIDEDEFFDVLECNPEVVDKFSLLGFDEEELPSLFYDLQDGDGVLEVKDFVYNLSVMRGNARSADVIRIKQNVARLHKRLDSLFDLLDTQNTVPETRRHSFRPSHSAIHPVRPGSTSEPSSGSPSSQLGNFHRIPSNMHRTASSKREKTSALKKRGGPGLKKVASNKKVELTVSKTSTGETSLQIPEKGITFGNHHNSLDASHSLGQTSHTLLAIPGPNGGHSPNNSIQYNHSTTKTSDHSHNHHSHGHGTNTCNNHSPMKGNADSQSEAGSSCMLSVPGMVQLSMPNSTTMGTQDSEATMILTTVCEEIRGQLQEQLSEMEKHVADVVRAELTQQTRLSIPNKSVDSMSEQFRTTVWSLASENLAELKLRIAKSIRVELAQKVEQEQMHMQRKPLKDKYGSIELVQESAELKSRGDVKELAETSLSGINVEKIQDRRRCSIEEEMQQRRGDVEEYAEVSPNGSLKETKERRCGDMENRSGINSEEEEKKRKSDLKEGLEEISI